MKSTEGSAGDVEYFYVRSVLVLCVSSVRAVVPYTRREIIGSVTGASGVLFVPHVQGSVVLIVSVARGRR